MADWIQLKPTLNLVSLRMQEDYTIGTQILVDLGIHELKLMTNNPLKVYGLEGYNLKIIERVPIEMEPGKYDSFYLRTKKEKMGHLLNM